MCRICDFFMCVGKYLKFDVISHFTFLKLLTEIYDEYFCNGRKSKKKLSVFQEVFHSFSRFKTLHSELCGKILFAVGRYLLTFYRSETLWLSDKYDLLSIRLFSFLKKLFFFGMSKIIFLMG